MAAQAARQPAGRITAVFDTDAERQGAYDWLESPAFTPQQVSQATQQATALRCSGQPWVVVPVDKASLTLADLQVRKELGSVGTHSSKGRGLKVMSAIAGDSQGTPQGVLGQAYWSRPTQRNPVPRDQRRTQDKETRYWEQVMTQARGALAQQAPGTKPWFQLDREGDVWPVIMDALDHRPDQYITIRASWNRRLQDCAGSGDPSQGSAYLWSCLQQQAVMGDYLLHVSAGPKRTEREALMQVRAAPVVLDLRLVRLTYLARHQPQALAQQELTEHEVAAIVDLDREREWEGQQLTVAQAVDAIARLGGYVGPSSGGPPGMMVLMRGLLKVQAVATAYRNRVRRRLDG